MKFAQFKYSTTGPRSENQDSILVHDESEEIVGCIADGVSGSKCGKLAAETSTSNFLEYFIEKKQPILEIVKKIHLDIKNIQTIKRECTGMASTFTACVIKDKFLQGIHTGDTRLCLLRGNGIKQLTVSHTEGHSLYLAGKLTLQEYKDYPRNHILASALGMTGEPIFQEFTYELQMGDRILLTSDGVHEMITKQKFRDYSIQSASVEQFSHVIINNLNGIKLKDNASFIAIEVL